MIKFDTIPTTAFFFQEIGVEYQSVLNRTQERMWGRKIIKKSSLCGYNYSCCLDTLFCLADKAISSLSIETPLIRSFCSTISEGNLFYTRGDTLPSRDFLG